MDEMVKAQFTTAAIVNIFTNAIKDKDILELQDVTPYIEKSKEIAVKLIESL